jgi:thiamine-monophosphate kinase
MKPMNEIIENAMISSWVRHFLRHPSQVNQLHESDAELLEIPTDPQNYLAVTIDTVADEVANGLYQDPYTIGWVTVMACTSDLAAVGAYPLGMVLSVCVESKRDKAFTDAIARGIADACQRLGIFILGGDINLTPSLSLTGCAFGTVPRKSVMTRCGCQEGEYLFISGEAGIGNALGLVRLKNLPGELFPETLYRPTAHIHHGQIIAPFASCCMDTSDGVLTTLDQLIRLNNKGFIIAGDWDQILSPLVWQLCKKTKTPPWAMLAGPHGEFRLIFTVPTNNVDSLLARFQTTKNKPILLGRVQEKPVITIKSPAGDMKDIDMAPLRNLLDSVNGNLQRYVEEFMECISRWGLGE